MTINMSDYSFYRLMFQLISCLNECSQIILCSLNDPVQTRSLVFNFRYILCIWISLHHPERYFFQSVHSCKISVFINIICYLLLMRIVAVIVYYDLRQESLLSLENYPPLTFASSFEHVVS